MFLMDEALRQGSTARVRRVARGVGAEHICIEPRIRTRYPFGESSAQCTSNDGVRGVWMCVQRCCAHAAPSSQHPTCITVAPEAGAASPRERQAGALEAQSPSARTLWVSGRPVHGWCMAGEQAQGDGCCAQDRARAACRAWLSCRAVHRVPRSARSARGTPELTAPCPPWPAWGHPLLLCRPHKVPRPVHFDGQPLPSSRHGSDVNAERAVCSALLHHRRLLPRADRQPLQRVEH
jgi:hypothetical protein